MLLHLLHLIGSFRAHGPGFGHHGVPTWTPGRGFHGCLSCLRFGRWPGGISS